MSADELRRAAALIRERAEVCLAYTDEWYSAEELSDFLLRVDVPNTAQGSDADHIASWHPAVTLAVADWLDGVALHLEARIDEEWLDLDGDPISPEDTHAIGSALAVARAYLAGES
jgi:hypothetical protein